jgi:hypothetical protein
MTQPSKFIPYEEALRNEIPGALLNYCIGTQSAST